MSEDSEEFTPEMVTDEMMKAYDFGNAVIKYYASSLDELKVWTAAIIVNESPVWAEYKKLRELNKRYKARIEYLTDELSEYNPDIRDCLVPLEGLEN